jgi:AcrR family transcriptional regulator
VKSARHYRMTARAESAARTAQRIMDAAGALFETRDFDEWSLQSVADAAGVTLQTVIRRFGSKDGLVNATAAARMPTIRRSRLVAVPGSAGEAVSTLVASYEAMGELNWRLLRQAHRVPALESILRQARALHRQWIEETFAPRLPPRGRARERRVLLLFAATDFYQWKLLRLDLGLPRAEVERLMTDHVAALLKRER